MDKIISKYKDDRIYDLDALGFTKNNNCCNRHKNDFPGEGRQIQVI